MVPSPLRWSSESKLPARLLSHHWLLQSGLPSLKLLLPVAGLEVSAS